ncbi:hypothetical protein CLV78_107201 [Aliiruegeria haliotis]|uniref:Uncharacterized protein n=1 Tax=Aliiruegeria haliotis TaxID=1280846 RepID=A0A2T0RMB7_9RHOB|nr:hypothetical protein CLV78_107201 [Aliiruegeria haliotis]
MRFLASIFRTPHHRAQEDSFELAAINCKVAVWLAESGDDLRHLKTEDPVGIGDSRTVAMRIAFVAFGRVCPDLNAPPSKRSAIACAGTDPVHRPAATQAPSVARSERRDAMVLDIGGSRF